MENFYKNILENYIIHDKVINESILNKLFNNKDNKHASIFTTCYVATYCVNGKAYTSPGEVYSSWYHYETTKSDAIMWYITKHKYGVVENDTLYIYKSKYASLKNEKISIFKGRLLTKGNISGECKIKITEELENDISLEDALKFVSSYEIKDNNSIIAKRKNIYSKLIKITKETLNEIGKDELHNGFKLYKYTTDNNELDSFFAGTSNYVNLIDCNAWNFTNNKARDEVEYSKYDNVFNKITTILKEKIEKNNISGKVDYYGDWDDGPIVFLLKDS